MSASRPPNDGVRNALRRRVGQRFHADAYARWAAGEVFVEIARKCGVSERQVCRWAVAERWREQLEATQRKAAMLAVDKDAERLAGMTFRHRKGAQAIQRYVRGLLAGGTMVIDPRTNRPCGITKADGTSGGFEIRPLLPAELNQAAAAFAKAAELEYGRAGGKTQEPERASPDLEALLDKVWAEEQAKPKGVGSGTTGRPSLPEADPRMRLLRGRGEV